MTNSDGTTLKNLTNNPYHDVHPVFSPDGQKVVFSSKRNGNSDIFVLNINDNTVQQITNSSSTEDYPSWSPDGTKLTFKQIENLNDFYTINADGTNRTRLESAPPGFYDLVFIWMPAKENMNLSKN